jgi:hypothetical protein
MSYGKRTRWTSHWPTSSHMPDPARMGLRGAQAKSAAKSKRAVKITLARTSLEKEEKSDGRK